MIGGRKDREVRRRLERMEDELRDLRRGQRLLTLLVLLVLLVQLLSEFFPLMRSLALGVVAAASLYFLWRTFGPTPSAAADEHEDDLE
ncbi:MAG: hypothetical protein ACYS26_07125 [Planctomycetota bacterium]|jgi:hypothetical protein